MELFPLGLVEDVEKGNPLAPSPTETHSTTGTTESSPPKWKKIYRATSAYLVSWKLEARGIQRVEAHERHSLQTLGFTQVGIVWFSMNLAANNITLGMLGPVVFELGFLDATLLAFFGQLVGNLAVGYQAMFGPRSGNRTLIVARYTMGWWPVKLIVLLNIVVMLGYSLIDVVIAGQMLSAVSPHNSLSLVVGIIVTSLITWTISTFGYRIFHYYERYAWLPQLIVLCVLAGVAGPKFDLSSESQGDARTIVGNRLSFFSLCLAAAITYSGAGADFFVYYPEHTAGWKVFAVTNAGLALSFTFMFILGIGLASAIPTNTAWSDAYNSSQGALIVEAYRPLGTFGSICSVMVALGLVANLVPPAYSSGLDFQILGRWFEKVPRPIWNTLGIVIFTVCALAGRDHLAEIFTNFLALMGYWVVIWIAISLEEEFLFRPKMKTPDNDRGFDWTAWNEKDKLPHGYAALLAFLVGWAGAILSMAQLWYIGPLAAPVGDYGADMGNYVGFAWAALVFPPLRWLELKKFKR
ncbi:putative nucleoside transporter [Rhizodiscina lignyota]|uniref:Nucleoside transporter n=1 Tax=Rhizodiscina lignyota TaxID=1504668 RepID=A0A9P4I5W4_9PEZI|nr:putative nucleoside transporter [Rhizodiscina lignyota]